MTKGDIPEKKLCPKIDFQKYTGKPILPQNSVSLILEKCRPGKYIEHQSFAA